MVTVVIQYLDKYKENGRVLVEDSNLVVQTGHRMERMKTVLIGNIALSWDTLRVMYETGEVFKEFSVKDITGINVQNKEKLDFYVDGDLYNIFDKKRRFSVYKWLNAIQYMQKEELSGD